MLHKRNNPGIDNYEMAHVGPIHLQGVPMKRESKRNGMDTLWL